MKSSEIKANLNCPVKCDNSNYILTGGIIRKNEQGECYYQAEITDKCKNSVSVCKLEDVEADNE